MRWSCVVVFSLCSIVTAQERPTTEASAPKAKSPLEVLRAADEAGRPAALSAFVDSKIATNAVFSGQYDELKTLDWDAEALLLAWTVAAPSKIKAAPASFRDACLNALRDVVDEPSDELMSTLQKFATDSSTPPNIATKAKYTLAQFGNTEHVDAMIAAAKKDTEDPQPNKRIGAFDRLANIYYNLRKFDDAAKAYKEVHNRIEALNPNFRGLATSYYNCACSLALAGETAEALAMVEKALAHGKRVGAPLGKGLLTSDMDIRSLRDEPKFKELMFTYFKIGQPASKPTSEPGK